MKSNLNIYAIQNDIEEFDFALSKVDKGINYIYSNCTYDLKIGWNKIKRKKFDTFLYNEESDTIILLLKNGIFNKSDLINFLEKTNKEYYEINFKKLNKSCETNDEYSNLYFCRDKESLKEYLKYFINNNDIYCEYYPDVESYFMLGYVTESDEKIEVEGRVFRGLLKIDNKLVLIVNQKYNFNEFGESRNLTEEEILKILHNLNIKTRIIYGTSPILKNTQVKKLTLNDKTY